MTVWETLNQTLAGPTYSSMDNPTTAATYNAQTVTISQPIIPLSALLDWGATGPYAQLVAGQTFTNSNAALQVAVQAACISAVTLFQGSIPNFNTASTANQNLMELLVTAGVWASADVTALNALASVTVPLYTQPGQPGQPITAADVVACRS